MITPVQFNGTIQTTQMVADVKAGEDARPQVQQHVATDTVIQQEQKLAQTVVNSDDADSAYDYSRGGNGSGDTPSGRRQKKKDDPEDEDNPDGFVRVKGKRSTFDIKV